MAVYVTKEDIINEDGILLLKKDYRVDDDVVEKLKKFSSSILVDSKKAEIYNGKPLNNIDETSTKIIQSFGTRKNISNKRILEKPTEVLNKILFESKNEPWWIYINTLANYDGWVYTHSIDVGMMSLIMSIESGYGEKQLFYIGLGAILHDIGLLLLPKSILQRYESLNQTEQLTFRLHCELGVSSVATFNLPKECTDIILQHHERLDGSGYPKGLKEDEICLNSKIVMIADAIDTSTSERPDGQSANKMDEALKNFEEAKGFSHELICMFEKALQP